MRVAGPLFVDASGALLFAAVQDQVTLSASPTIYVYNVGLVGFVGDLGVGVEFR